MKKTITIILILLFVTKLHAEDKKYFSEKWFMMYEGFRNSTVEMRPSSSLDFMNYFYEADNFSDYAYFEVATKLNHQDIYQLEARISIYNSLIPYCFNLSYDRTIWGNLGWIGGAMSNRFYLKEYNQVFNELADFNHTHRSLKRQWNMNLFSVYTGPTFHYRYKTLQINLLLKAGVATFLPFQQKDILKDNSSNFKMVLDYNTNPTLGPFAMPELELAIDFIKYKKSIIGGRLKFAYYYSRTRINYTLDRYEWTYDNPITSDVHSLKHNFQQMDWDFGIFIRW